MGVFGAAMGGSWEAKPRVSCPREGRKGAASPGVDGDRGRPDGLTDCLYARHCLVRRRGRRPLPAVLAHLDRTPSLAGSTVTVIGNTGDDITLFGLRVCPDLDTVLYTLGGAVHEGQGWGRADEGYAVQAELAALGVQPDWFSLGDKDFGAHIARSLWLGQGGLAACRDRAVGSPLGAAGAWRDGAADDQHPRRDPRRRRRG